MSAEHVNEEELVDYEDDVENGITPAAATTKAVTTTTTAPKEDDDKEKSQKYIGVHSTGFRLAPFSRPPNERLSER